MFFLKTFNFLYTFCATTLTQKVSKRCALNLRGGRPSICSYEFVIPQTFKGYPKRSPGVNGLASSSSQETQIWATQKRPFWGVSLDNNNFRLKHLKRPSRKFNIIITPLKPKFYSKTFSFNLFNISKAERVHMNCFMRLCQIVKLHPDLVSLLCFWFLFFVDFFGPFLWLTERKDLFAMKLHSVK